VLELQRRRGGPPGSGRREVRPALPGDLLVAVGTVRTEQHAREAVDAGADVVVSQVLRPAGVDPAIGSVGIDDHLGRGAAAVGLSGPLLGDALLPGGDLDALAERARRATAATSAR
jgi:2-keto-3-deoxy-6-phosphogluconate aldolase